MNDFIAQNIIPNISLFLFFIALIVAAVEWMTRSKELSRIQSIDIFLAWGCFISMGIAGIIGFVMHTFFAEYTSNMLAWPPSPFQFQVAAANLAIGVGGIIAFWSSVSFRAAVIIMLATFLLVIDGGHIFDMTQRADFAPGHAVAIVYTELIIPAFYLILLFLRHRWNLQDEAQERENLE